MKSKIHMQSYLNIFKTALVQRNKKIIQFFFQSLSNFWNPFKDVEKQCHGRPAIGGHLTNQFCQRGGQDFQHISQNQILSFFSTFVGLHLKNQFYQEGKWEFQEISKIPFSSWKDNCYEWNCPCISVWQNNLMINQLWLWKIRETFVKIFHIFFQPEGLAPWER